MRTRIALAAIIPVALITVSTLTQAATAPPARAVTPSPGTNAPATVITMPAHQLAASRGLITDGSVLGRSSLLLNLNAPSTLAADTTPAPVPVATPAPAPAPPTAAVDTVTPEQRAAWERVAMCEEGGNWSAGGSRFSGGLGITRSNWDAYGGQQFAPVGAMATEDQQIMVAERIQSSPPDQYGCRGW
jgi:resuscitation-promoting factor RpfA